MNALLDVFFAGIWGEVWRFGIGAGLIILCVVGWYFSPILKKDFLYAAAIIAAFMTAFAIGVKTGEDRVWAQWKASVLAASDEASKAHDDAVRDVGSNPPKRVRNDKYDRSQQRREH